MKAIILFLTLVFCINLQAQKGILLIKKSNQKTTFLNENRRIKVFLQNGKAKAGRFKIVDNKTIIIKKDTLALDSLVKIQKASTFSAIISPVSMAIGGTFLAIGIAGAIAGGYGILATIILVPPGLPMFVIPNCTRKHNSEKWEYEIKE